MKRVLAKSVWCAAVSLMIVACTGEDVSSSVDGKPLQVELFGLQPTRAAITSTTLPDGSQYGIYVAYYGQIVKRGDNGYNIPVTYQSGKSTMSRDYILQSATDYSVYAAYPQENSSDVMTMQLETASQTDYLYGYAVDDNGGQAVINQDNHVAKIQMRHAMALLRFNIFQSEDNKQENIVTAVETYEMPVSASLNLQTGEQTQQKIGNNRIKCQFTAETTPHTVEMLVLPYNNGIHLSFEVNGKSIYAYRQQVLQAGNSYTYNVEIQSDAKILISEATITPRENETMETLVLNANMLPVGGTIGTPVDLGLSVKWADHNVGASSESEVGGHYMWGDPTGTATAATYNMPSLSNISDTQYDIAKTQWGGNWRLPTDTEIKELVDNTTYQWTTRNGVEGGLFTSKKAGFTDKSIFFPKYYGGDQGGSVWSGTKSFSNTARSLYYGKKEVTINSHDIGIGYSTPQTLTIRPVCK